MMTEDMSADSAYHMESMGPTADSQLMEDQLTGILATEHSYQVPHIPCRASMVDDNRLPYGEWRRKICQWSFKVIDHFRLDREVVSCAMNIFDRYLASMPKSFNMDTCPCPACQRTVDSRTFQLTAMTSLYLAIKMYSDGATEDETPRCRKLKLLSFVELSRGQFCSDDICMMEKAILKDLRWKVHPPTPMTLVSYFLRLMPPHSSIPASSVKRYDLVLHVLHELARYLTELSVCLGSVCSVHSPSQIAYSAILVSMDLLTYSALPLRVRASFNDRVFSISSAKGVTLLTPQDKTVLLLQDRLRHSFWPEMLMADCESADMGHPISMARDFGLLDISSINSSPTVSKSPTSIANLEGSPICISRAAI